MIVLSWKDKRGYTLVELIISMAILAIVGGAITLLMQSGTRSYSNTKAELDLQMESQKVMEQLSTMIMESNCVKYDSANNALILYQVVVKKIPMPSSSGAAPAGTVAPVSAVPATAAPEASAVPGTAAPAASGTPGVTAAPTPAADSKFQQVKTVKDLKIIKFDGKKLYLEEHSGDAALPADRSEGLNCKTEELFSDYVDSFNVGIEGNNVTVSFEMKSGNKTYKIDETTKIRNGLVVYP